MGKYGKQIFCVSCGVFRESRMLDALRSKIKCSIDEIFIAKVFIAFSVSGFLEFLDSLSFH